MKCQYFIAPDHFENLCVARCRDDWRLRTSLAKEIEGQMSIVTKLPDVLALSRAFISDRSKEYMTWLLIYTKTGREGHGGRTLVGIQVATWTCVYIPIAKCRVGVEQLA